MIRPPGIEAGVFVVSPGSVWYARVLQLFPATVNTDTGLKSFDWALVFTLETYDDAVIIIIVIVVVSIFITFSLKT